MFFLTRNHGISNYDSVNCMLSHNVLLNTCCVVARSEIGRQWTVIRRTSGSLLQRSVGNCLWYQLRRCRCHRCLQKPWNRV